MVKAGVESISTTIDPTFSHDNAIAIMRAPEYGKGRLMHPDQIHLLHMRIAAGQIPPPQGWTPIRAAVTPPAPTRRTPNIPTPPVRPEGVPAGKVQITREQMETTLRADDEKELAKTFEGFEGF
jgi:hypothetical protein